MNLDFAFKSEHELGTSFTLRNFKPQDLDAVMHINLTCLPENYTPSFYMNHYESFPKAFYVAEVDSKIIGYVMSRVERGLSNHKPISVVKKGHIISIAVLPDYRRKGVGKSLMINSLKGLKDYGAEECYLEVRISNTPAINLYKSLDFEIIRIIRGYYLNGEDAYLMSRRLDFLPEDCTF
ncbi:ribosomal protein S18-alanine N-acetyltransferase [Candidatus Bathyarchaeota archaeon]|nr:ribosomal protein S18-alanine N-acetyltransferase [Candidatus Bathyarchaeota archaeon]MBS7613275.1 ribosomal protein S18-alanine N-acetyltransferase [Candidatus Bathyarchaeota archaeon]MBS7617650.1 ribosomal protein S18-alanine N-acetyltransferase [Candidatus Bathyarchaeota archaeon]